MKQMIMIVVLSAATCNIRGKTNAVYSRLLWMGEKTFNSEKITNSPSPIQAFKFYLVSTGVEVVFEFDYVLVF